MNGSGKSSLLRILAGQDKEFDGFLQLADGIRVGYLEQEPSLDSGPTVEENIRPALAIMQALLTEFEEVWLHLLLNSKTLHIRHYWPLTSAHQSLQVVCRFFWWTGILGLNVQRFQQVSQKMADPDADVDALMARMDRLQSEIDAGNGWELERQLERATDALRCPPGDKVMLHIDFLYVHIRFYNL